jgi:molybdopterin biosynthesis enzyme
MHVFLYNIREGKRLSETAREAERTLFMLVVASETEVTELIHKTFGALRTDSVQAALGEAAGRVLAADCAATEDVPSFDRSTVDGYAVRASEPSAAAKTCRHF